MKGKEIKEIKEIRITKKWNSLQGCETYDIIRYDSDGNKYGFHKNTNFEEVCNEIMRNLQRSDER